MVNLRVGNAQIIGARKEQQDAFGFTDKDNERFVTHGGVLAVVADGMGGHAHGGNASRIAVKAFLQDYMSKPEHVPIPAALDQAFLAANDAVCAFAEAAGESGNCGTTLVAAVVHPASLSLHWIGSGDSRIFLFREPLWAQITTDANYGNHLLNNHIQGMPLDDYAENEGHLEELTSFLGQPILAEIDRSIRGFSLHPGDWLVLCTDGVFNSLNKDELVDCLRGDPNQSCENIIQGVSAKSLKYQDNATVVMIACDFNASTAGQADTWASRLKALIVKLGLGLFPFIMFAIAFSLGVYVGQNWLCGNS